MVGISEPAPAHPPAGPPPAGQQAPPAPPNLHHPENSNATNQTPPNLHHPENSNGTNQTPPNNPSTHQTMMPNFAIPGTSSQPVLPPQSVIQGQMMANEPQPSTSGAVARPSTSRAVARPSTSRACPGCSTAGAGRPRKGDNSRESRNKAEKARRDRLNQSIAELASMVPTVLEAGAGRKLDKTAILRLSAHYLRAHDYVFGAAIEQARSEALPEFSAGATMAVLGLLQAFLVTTTYKGIVVVMSPNVNQYLGYNVFELLGQSIIPIVHEDDSEMLLEQLLPNPNVLGPNGELRLPEDLEERRKMFDMIETESRSFLIRFKKVNQSSETPEYVTCHVEGIFRRADSACRIKVPCCQIVRRNRFRGVVPRVSSGNDLVFIAMVKPVSDSFITEREIEAYRMEYRTRHSVDGGIIQTEHRISLVTGYMSHEVNGVNALNFIHKDDVRWVAMALREMYDNRRLTGESSYRLLTKNGQFIYMRTRGHLEVEQGSTVTTLVCINTVVDDIEGRHLIRLMKKNLKRIMGDNSELPPVSEGTEYDDIRPPVEDPRTLQRVIMRLVTGLPTRAPEEGIPSTSRGAIPRAPNQLSIIAPNKERIYKAIDKIYDVFKILKRPTTEDTVMTPLPTYQDIKNVIKSLEMPKIEKELNFNVFLEEPKPVCFEQHFFNLGREYGIRPNASKLSDQVLGAVQLLHMGGFPDQAICLPPGAVKRPTAEEHVGDLFSSTRMSNNRSEDSGDKDDMENDMRDDASPFFTDTELENLLAENGLAGELGDDGDSLDILQSIGNGNGSMSSFPDILLGPEFDELFDNLSGDLSNEMPQNEEPEE